MTVCLPHPHPAALWGARRGAGDRNRGSGLAGAGGAMRQGRPPPPRCGFVVGSWRAPTPHATASPLRTLFQYSLSLFLQPTSWNPVAGGVECGRTPVYSPGRAKRTPPAGTMLCRDTLSKRERGQPHGDEKGPLHGIRVASSNFPKTCTLPRWSYTHIAMLEDRAPDRDPSCEQNAPKHGGWVDGPALAGWVQKFLLRRHFEVRNATVGDTF